MLQRMQDEQPDKPDDQGLTAISETLKSRPVDCNFTIKKGGAANGNCILRVDRRSSKINGEYCRGNYRPARSIIMPCLELQAHWNYIQSPRTINIIIKRK